MPPTDPKETAENGLKAIAKAVAFLGWCIVAAPRMNHISNPNAVQDSIEKEYRNNF